MDHAKPVSYLGFLLPYGDLQNPKFSVPMILPSLVFLPSSQIDKGFFLFEANCSFYLYCPKRFQRFTSWNNHVLITSWNSTKNYNIGSTGSIESAVDTASWCSAEIWKKGPIPDTTNSQDWRYLVWQIVTQNAKASECLPDPQELILFPPKIEMQFLTWCNCAMCSCFHVIVGMSFCVKTPWGKLSLL